MKKKKSKLLFRRNPNYCSFVIKCDIIFIRYAMNRIFSAKLCSSIHILKGLRSNKQHRMTCFQVYLREELIPLSHGFSQRDNTLFATQRHLAISQLSQLKYGFPIKKGMTCLSGTCVFMSSIFNLYRLLLKFSPVCSRLN